MELFTAFESAPSRAAARKILANRTLDGLPEAAFNRVATLAGQEPAACVRLAKRTDLLLSDGYSPRDSAYILRTQAVGERAAGRWLRAAKLFVEAGRLLDDTDCWVFSIGAIDSYARAGLPEEAIAYGREALEALENDPMMAARVRLSLGNAFAWQDRNGEAIIEYKQALSNLSSEAAFEQAIAHLGISTASLISGDPLEAEIHAIQSGQLFTELGSTYHADLAEINLAQADILLGRADKAVRRFLDLLPRLENSAPDAVRINEFLGDAYMRLNLREEAKQAYADALKMPQIKEMPLNRANCYYGLATSSPQESASHFRRAAALYRKVGNTPWECSAAGRASLLSPRVSSNRVRATLERLRETGSRFLAEELGLLAAESGILPITINPSSPLLEWRFAWLEAKRQPSLKSYRAVFDLIERDRLAVSTPSAAMHFLDDRGRAVTEYIDLLLDAGQVQTAIEVIARIRSAALVDEILATRGVKLQPEAIAELDRLRVALQDEGSPGQRLRASVDQPTVARGWIEKTWAAKKQVLTTDGSKISGDIWFQSGNRLRCVRDNIVNESAITPEELHAKLNWLEFFLFEPMLDRSANPAQIQPILDELSKTLGQPEKAVSPEGELWRIPWTLLAEHEITLLLSPHFGASAGESVLSEGGRVAIWAAYSADLPELESEIKQLTTLFPDAHLLESREAVRKTYGQIYDLIHVAGHARINLASPSFSYIDFEDGPLYAAEIARSGLGTDLAIIAACQTGLTTSHQGHEPEGIVRSFLACGAKAALASLWPLDDKFTYQFMSHLYPMLKRGETLSDSVKEARRATKLEFPHPYFWGSLALFGGYQSS